MKVAFDLRHARSTPLLTLIRTLLETDRSHQWSLYCTIFNYLDLDVSAENIQRRTLPIADYYEDLERHLKFDDDVDLLVRTSPHNDTVDFPRARQVVFLENVPSDREQPDPVSQKQTQVLHQFQVEAGALATLSRDVEAFVNASPWTKAPTRFLNGGTPGESAKELLTLLESTAKAARPAPIRVDTPPLVSIVTPSFNQGRFIRRTIDSVLQQDYPHIQYRVVDGGSTDETVAIMKSYGSRLAWTSERDGGQTEAINTGLAQSAGQIQAYLNSDDVLRPGAVRHAVEHFRNHPACDMVYGRGALVDSDDRYLGMHHTADYSFAELVDQCSVCQPAAFWQRRITEHIGPFDESFRLAMDYDYWLRIAAGGGRIDHVPRLLAHSRLHDEAKSVATQRERWFEEIFRTSLAHANYVSRTHLQRWLTACVWPRCPWLSTLNDPLVNVLFRWYDRRLRTTEASRADTVRRTVRNLLRQMPVVGPLARSLKAHWVHSVHGFRADNWLTTVCRFPARPGQESPLVFKGEAPVPMQVQVRQKGVPTRAIDLPGGEPVQIVLPDSAGPTTLNFSTHVLSLDGKPIAFRLMGTNVFKERDAA